MAESEETRKRVLTTIAGKVGYDIYPSLTPVLVNVETNDCPTPLSVSPQPEPEPPAKQTAEAEEESPDESHDSDMLTEGSSQEDDEYMVNSYIY